MRIEALTTFLDGRERFEKGDIRTVQDSDGTRFVTAGWAKDLGGGVATGDAQSDPVALDIHNSVIGVKDTSNG
jgi:hypothetical protein